jgi:hypothetical protein
LSDKPKRDWFETFITVTVAVLVGGSVAYILAMFVRVLMIMGVI